jgi:hypothetical protein
MQINFLAVYRRPDGKHDFITLKDREPKDRPARQEMHPGGKHWQTGKQIADFASNLWTCNVKKSDLSPEEWSYVKKIVETAKPQKGKKGLGWWFVRMSDEKLLLAEF